MLELDELWSFVGAKAQTLWLWVALCRRTRQIVAYTLGDRSQQSAADLRASLPPDYRGRATRSDLWEAYAAAFPARTHRCCGKEEGETNHVERWFGTLRARVSAPGPQSLLFLQVPREPPRCHPLLHHYLQSANQAVNSEVNTTEGDNGRRARSQRGIYVGNASPQNPSVAWTSLPLTSTLFSSSRVVEDRRSLASKV